MAANEFEKNVRIVMDEFRLHPSEEVWQNVAKKIQEKKRKRRIVFFLILSSLGLIVAGYGIDNFLTRGKSKSAQQNLKLSSKAQNKEYKKQESTGIENTLVKNTNPIENRVDAGIVNKRSINNKIQPGKYHGRKETIKLPPQNKFAIHLKNESATTIAGSIETKPGKEQGNDASDKKYKENTQNISINNNKPGSPDTTNEKLTISPEKKGMLTANTADSVLKKNNEDKKEDAVSQLKKTNKNDRGSRRLKWGLNFSSGSSVIKQNFSIFKAGRQLNLAYSNPGTANGGAPGPASAQSSNKSSFALEAGVVLKKDLSKRSSLSAGFGYAYLADKIQTGAKQTNNAQINSLFNISTFYGGVTQKTFTDRFHFVELPIIYDWRITRNTDHFLSLNAGAAITYLISTNALVYDTTAGGIYYHKENLFSRTGIHIISGVTYHFITKGLECNIGPQLSLQLNRIIKSDFDNRKYFLFTGIEGVIFLKKKEK